MLEGGAGADELDFQGTDEAETVQLAVSGARALLVREVLPDSVTLDTGGIESFAVRAAGEADTLVVNDLAGTAVTGVALDLGTDAQADRVTAAGGGANDTIAAVAAGGAPAARSS